SIQRTLGPGAGTQTASATAAGLNGSPVTFTATATPNGTISGTVTLSNTFLAPPQPKAAAAGLPLSPLAPAKSAARGSAASLATALAQTGGTQGPEFVPDE